MYSCDLCRNTALLSLNCSSFEIIHASFSSSFKNIQLLKLISISKLIHWLIQDMQHNRVSNQRGKYMMQHARVLPKQVVRHHYTSKTIGRAY